MVKETIAQVAKKTALEFGRESIHWGDPELLGKIFQRAKMRPTPSGRKITDHPLNRNMRVLNALEGSPLFHKSYLRICAGKNTSERLVRCFVIKEQTNDQ
jgi:hypothetical protein